MTNAELVQVYKNVKRNASVFSAIAQTHGNPSALYDYATKIAGELTDKMRARDIRADDIAPKPFDLDDEQNEEAVRTLGRALLLPLAGEGVDPQLVLNQLVQHQAGDDLWMQSLPYLSDGEIVRSATISGATAHSCRPSPKPMATPVRSMVSPRDSSAF